MLKVTASIVVNGKKNKAVVLTGPTLAGKGEIRGKRQEVNAALDTLEDQLATGGDHGQPKHEDTVRLYVSVDGEPATQAEGFHVGYGADWDVHRGGGAVLANAVAATLATVGFTRV